jgi:hypothetical protein
MLEVNSPGENGSMIGVHAIRNRFVASDICIAGEKRGSFQRVTCRPFHPLALVDILHQIESPRHSKQRVESAQRSNERACLNGTRVDQIRLDFADDSPKIHHQPQQIAPAEFALSARPEHLLDFQWNGTILHLSRTALEAHVKDLMLGLR